MLIDSIGRIRPVLRFFCSAVLLAILAMNDIWTTSWHHLASTRFRRCWCYPYTLQSMKSTTSVAKKLSLCHFFQIGFGMSPSIDLFLILKKCRKTWTTLIFTEFYYALLTKAEKVTVTLAALFQRSCLTDHQISSDAMTTRRGRSILLCLVLAGAPWEWMDKGVICKRSIFWCVAISFSYLFRT